MSVLKHTVTRAQSGRTVKTILKQELGLSTTLINRLKRTETGLQTNGTRVFTNAILREGDKLTVNLSVAERGSALTPIPIALDILYEDEHLLVINKAASLASIPSSLVPGEPSVAAGLAHYLKDGTSIHLVNRLDKGTTGLMAVAKSAYIHECLRQQMHTPEFQRTYLAICLGGPENQSGRIEQPIGRAPGSAIRRRIDPEGKPAVTDYRVIERTNRFSLVELVPRTGRTHQLRVHMSSLGCPLAGDWLYGEEDRELIPRPALHACRLSLAHPVTGARLSLEAALPEDMRKLLERER